jgi:D-glycero-D-manno-heptose 1,7-bisphosphate phosphatase
MADVFVDRDGVINRNRPNHVTSWREFEFLPGSLDALARLTGAGHRIFVVTNQAIVARGTVRPETVARINQHMTEEVARHGGVIEGVLVCPHVPEDGCYCRKPMPGLFLQARDTRGVVLGSAFVIGDFSSDLEAARSAGCTGILVLTGRGAATLAAMSAAERRRCWIARDLTHAAELILEATAPRRARAARGDGKLSPASIREARLSRPAVGAVDGHAPREISSQVPRSPCSNEREVG